MRISAIDKCCPKPNFTAKQQKYENPIDRQKERNLAILASTGGGLLLGGTIAGVATCFMQSLSKTKRYTIAGLIGAAAMAATMILTLPAKLYDTKVNAMVREKEMDVFSRKKSAESNILGEVDKEIQDEDVSLDQKINHYTTVKMADNGNGLLIKGA